MSEKFRIFCRASGVWYIESKETKEQESLRTRDKAEAQRLLQAKNDAYRLPAINVQIARAYLSASDPKLVSRTWQEVMDTVVALKHDETHRRWSVAIKDKNYDCIRQLPRRKSGPTISSKRSKTAKSRQTFICGAFITSLWQWTGC